MAEALKLTQGNSKEETYQEILPQIESLLSNESDLVANLANVCAVVNQAFQHLWTGFYLRQDNELVLGPFQGPLACTRIPLTPVAKGVCGAAAERKETLVVPDVEKFPGHIACSSLSQSEIVVPYQKDGYVFFVLDIDSKHLESFDDVDAQYLERLVEIIGEKHFS